MSRKKNKRKRYKVSFDIGREINKALQYHQSGQLQKAEEIYKKILEIDPNHSDSLHLSGIIAHQVGKNDIAVNLINKAIQQNPKSPIYYNNLGIALKDQDRLSEAISSYQKALDLEPAYADAYNNMGNAFKDQGKLDEAISSYQKALQLRPDDAEVYNNLGNAFKDQGRLDEAISSYQKALELNPDLAKVYNNLGAAFKDQGRLDEAISSYQKALRLKPDFAEAYNNLGAAFKDQGRLSEAISCYEKALELKPDFAEAYNNLGAAFKDQGRLSEAISCYEKALQLKPDFAEAYNNLGAAFKDQGRSSEAISCHEKALQLKPDFAEAYNNLGAAFKDQGRLSEAISSYEKALELKPDFAEAYNNLGNVFKDQGNLNKAISCYQKALELKPDRAETYNNMGAAFQDQGRLNEAAACYQKALKLKPDRAETYSNMGNAFKDQGNLNEAISCYQKALELKPDCPEAYSELVHQLQRTCAWQKLDGLTDKLDGLTRKALDNGTKPAESPFISLARDADLSRNFAIAESWSCDIARAMSSLKMHFSFNDKRSRKTKIAIGYLSNDFRNHPVAHLMLSLFGLHNRDEFEVFCYSYGEDDGGYYRKRIEQDCDKFVDLRNLNHADAAKCIYEDHVDILVDLKGYTGGNRLGICAVRPAPIQVRYLGLAGTTGADFFDYIITDRIVTPEDHAQYYSENFVCLPHCYQVNDHTQAISNKDWKKGDFGLPEGSLVFCSFNQGYKIDPVMFNSWMNILRQVPESVLWLQRVNETAEKNLRQEAEPRGVKPERLIFAKRLSKDEHLARLKLADVALDTRIVSGAATTSDALWAGVPVITLQGSNFASRMSSSILTAIGLSELIAHSLGEYEVLVVRLARNPGELQVIRHRLAKNRLTEPLFDTSRFAGNLETAYKEMWEIFVTVQRPRQIEVVES